MLTADIRRTWLSFFETRQHTVVPSASLVSDDPSLLFTVAGMVPFVPYLTGVVPAPFSRATSVQKCIRTNDIDEVGKTAQHGTFFQMNGNFSFGDYFKEEAIGFAWELLTSPEADGGLGFDARDLWVTVYKDDDESIHFWKKTSGLPDERIQRLGADTNYWSTGQPGPAGPCSEIFFDRGPALGVDGGPATDSDRYVEIWNLVFMQYLRGKGTGKSDFEILGELPTKNIDTGMGLERVAFIKQGVGSMYEIDQVRPVLDRACEISGVVYGKDPETDTRLRVVADHVRSALMLLGDGVSPSNEGRGYIVRRLLRRTIRAMRLMGVDSAMLPDLVPVSRDAMKAVYPDVAREFEGISRKAYEEEQIFLRTLASGTNILDMAVDAAKSKHCESVPGETVFLLHDTYGFPIDLTLEMVSEAGLTVNRDVFDTLMADQRARAKADARAKKTTLADLSVYGDIRAKGESVFVGYDTLSTESHVSGIIVGGAVVDRAREGDVAEVILAETVLYAEAGGQEADAGTITGPGYELEVLDVQRPVRGLISHKVRVRSGEVYTDAVAMSTVDPDWRTGATQAHSATHVIHAALRHLLGPTAQQAGSYNKAGYMRLDFSWSSALSSETKTEIEDVCNKAIRDNLKVVTRVMPLDEARALGAMALFGEKYGDTVRVVDIGGPWSRELCAGTHVATSAEIGMINLLGESSVGASNRRVEALVGRDAFRAFAAERALVSELSSLVKVSRDTLPDRIAELLSQLKTAEKKIAAYEAQQRSGRIPDLLQNARDHAGYMVIAENLGVAENVDDVRSLAVAVRRKVDSHTAVVALAASVAEKPIVIVATTQAARDKGARAGQLVRRAATIMGGGGGGKDDLAQGGGSQTAAIPDALTAIVDSL